MLVSHRYRFIFLKTRKTAGSSVELAFEPYARPLGWMPPDGEVPFVTEETVSEAGIVGARGADLKKGAVFIDHMPAFHLRKRLPRKVWNSYFKFCTIRNPWDKTVSFFHYAHKRVRDDPPHLNVRRFRKWLQTNHHVRVKDNPIYWIGRKPAMDGYIRYHRLEEDAAAVAAHLGIPEPLAIGGVHTQHRSRDGLSYLDYYDDASREIVARSLADEIGFFGWTFDNSVEIDVPQSRPKRAWWAAFMPDKAWQGPARPSMAPALGRTTIQSATAGGVSQTNE